MGMKKLICFREMVDNFLRVFNKKGGRIIQEGEEKVDK